MLLNTKTIITLEDIRLILQTPNIFLHRLRTLDSIPNHLRCMNRKNDYSEQNLSVFMYSGNQIIVEGQICETLKF